MKKTLSAKDRTALLETLSTRFEKHPQRHKGQVWKEVLKRIEAHPEKLVALHAMEESGGEPDVTGIDKKSGAFIFMDCAAESPKDRRSLCYDREAHDARKENKPAGSAMEMAAAMGVELLTEEQYRDLQQLGRFDTKTSSWLLTPSEVRKEGGAIFGDYRFGRVFVYHNGASSYYAARGFRSVVFV